MTWHLAGVWCGATFLACATCARADEVCRFQGTTDYDGHVGVTTVAAAAPGGETRVEVAVTFTAREMLFVHIRYLIDEVSLWRRGRLQRVAVNNRYFAGGHIVRQQWDDFRRAPGGLEARRVQSKTLDEFRQKHPGFTRHWDPATFGAPWLDDYAGATAERRPDLDLASPPEALSPPLAFAFYGVRWLPPEGRDTTIFLPGFKADQLVDVPIVPGDRVGETTWRVPLRTDWLSDHPESSATATTSPDRHLLRLAFELHGSRGSARGLIEQEGCAGDAVAPSEDPR